jgi:hypothetical protein
MNQYHKLCTPQGSALVFIDQQPQMNFGMGIEYAYTMVHHAPQSALKPQIVPKSAH